MILETASQIPLSQAHRLVSLLDDREREIKGFSEAMKALQTAHKEALQRLDGQIWSLRLEITTGQTSMLDAMEVDHADPASNGSGQ